MNKQVLCRFCKQPIHIDHFAGISKDGFVCNNVSCLVKLAKTLKGEAGE